MESARTLFGLILAQIPALWGIGREELLVPWQQSPGPRQERAGCALGTVARLPGGPGSSQHLPTPQLPPVPAINLLPLFSCHLLRAVPRGASINRISS